MRPIAALLLVVALLPQPARAQGQGVPDVLASIKPLHSIAATVMQGVGTPDLLLTGGSSPHSYSLRPTDAEKIARAGIVFWVGPELEEFLETPLHNLATKAVVVTLDKAPGVLRLPARRGGLWEADPDEPPDAQIDGHIWLDPVNAVAIAKVMATTLSRADPDHEVLYNRNVQRFAAQMDALNTRLAEELAPVRKTPYIVFHDAYHYFGHRYGLSPAGAVGVAADRPVGARRVADIRARIRNTHVPCVVAPPQFRPKLIETLTEGTSARIGVLDVLGAALTPGPALYATLMQRLGDGFRACLAP